MLVFFFFFNDTATTEIYTYGHTLSLHDALPISMVRAVAVERREPGLLGELIKAARRRGRRPGGRIIGALDARDVEQIVEIDSRPRRRILHRVEIGRAHV